MASANPSEDEVAALMKALWKPVTERHHTTTYAAIDPTRPALSTRGKTAVITGAGSGIGAAIALSLARSGIAALALLGRTEATLQRTRDAVLALGGATTVHLHSVDVRDEGALARAVAAFAAATDKGKVDFLVASAGTMPDMNNITEADPADWWDAFEISIKGNFNLLRAFAPVAAEGGVVVHISTAGVHAQFMPKVSSYRASRSASTKLFETFAHEYPHLRTVNVHPGLIKTQMGKKIEHVLNGIPWEDVSLPADFVNWVVSDEADFLHGKFVWANWDVEELIKRREEIMKDEWLFTITLKGWA